MDNYPNLQISITNCDSEPIHLIGNVQGHAGIIIAHPHTLIIEQCTHNLEPFVGVKNVIGKTVNELLSLPENYQSFKENKKHVLIENEFIRIAYCKGDKLYIEFEKNAHSTESDTPSFTRDLSEKLNHKQSIEQASQVVCDMIRDLVKYDRVMLYRFDEDWHGEVIAEARKSDAESFDQHHFPATDIPKQARAMMCRKKVRQIANVDTIPHAIHPYLNPRTGEPADMEMTDVRQPSDIHLQFLRNMNVGASLSISILVKEELWGLIACQNESPIFIDYPRRQVCEAAGDQLGLFISSWKEDLDMEQLDQYEKNSSVAIKSIEENRSVLEGLKLKIGNLTGICNASGMAVLTRNTIIHHGDIPSEESIKQIQTLVRSAKHDGQIVNTRNIHRYMGEQWSDSKIASGFLAFDNSTDEEIEFFIWFKPEIKTQRTWAGNPQKQQTTARELSDLNPRTSFEQWTEQVRHHSAPWTRTEITSVKSFKLEFLRSRSNLQKLRLQESLSKLEQAKSDLENSNKKLNHVNKELEKFAYTVSHDLRSPLNNISRLSYFIENDFREKIGEEGEQYLTMIRSQILKMNSFIEEILASSKSGHTVNEPVEPIKEITTILMTLPKRNRIQVTIKDLPDLIEYSPRHFRQIIQNLVGNSIKYHDKENGKIEIGAKDMGENWEFFITDNGPGINNEAIPSIFEHFQTAHGTDRKDSTGVGLAIVKETVEKHKGTVRVESEIGKGTTFYFTVPK